MIQTNLAKNTIFLSIGTMLTSVLQFFMVPLFSKWLSTSDYGVFDLVLTYISLLLPIVSLATGEAVFRYSIESSYMEKRIFASNGFFVIVFNYIICAIILSAIGFITKRFIFFPFIILLFGQLLNSFFQSFLRGQKKLQIYSVGNVLTTVFIAFFVTILVFYFDFGLYGIILGYAVGYIAGVIFLFFFSHFYKFFSIKFVSVERIIYLIKYSYPLIPNNICWWIINASNRVIINFALGNIANGIYAISCKIPNVCASVFGMFNISWQEAASEIADYKDERNKYFNKVYSDMTVVLLSLCMLILSLNFFFADFLFDPRYVEAFNYTPILITSIIFSSLAQFYGGIMISLKRPKANGVTTVISAAVNLLVHMIFVSFIGLYAASIATLLSNFTMMIIRKIALYNDATCKWNRKVYVCWVLYLCYFVISYIKISIVIRMINFIVANIIFLIINRSFILSILHRLCPKMNKE